MIYRDPSGVDRIAAVDHTIDDSICPSLVDSNAIVNDLALSAAGDITNQDAGADTGNISYCFA